MKANAYTVCALCDEPIRRGEYVTRHQLKDTP